MTAQLETDTAVWVVAGSLYCGVGGCSQPAEIVADDEEHHRFCSSHLAEAATTAPRSPHFDGWYRIEASSDDARAVVLTVHPL